jgi:hypothetical protein
LLEDGSAELSASNASILALHFQGFGSRMRGRIDRAGGARRFIFG